MVGISAFGAYVPRLRLNRRAIADSMSWLTPGVAGLARGERAVRNFDEDSVTMAVAAARDCLAGVDRADVDGLYVASTTHPFADRSSAGIVATALNLRDDLRTADFSSSQKAGTAALVTALDAAAGGKQILVTAADARDSRPGSVGESLYGDAAAAVLVGDRDVVAELEATYATSHDFVDHYRGATDRFDYTWEERWVRTEGYDRFIADAVSGLLGRLDLQIQDVDHIVFPAAKARDHAGIAKGLGATPEQVQDNLYATCGEAGVAHPLLMLVGALERAKPGDRIVVVSFGQGSDAISLRVTDRIGQPAPGAGLAGALAQRMPLENYMKYLHFRELVSPELGIRAEAPTQTSLTALWRNRKTIEGLVGGQCRECGVPQYPKARLCVNETCRAIDAQDDYPFADVPAYVKSFTGDHLAVTPDPPAVYGMVQFEGGGRFVADFTDCTLEEVAVSMPVRMSFRRHVLDRQRGFSGYFWKAVPATGASASQSADAVANRGA